MKVVFNCEVRSLAVTYAKQNLSWWWMGRQMV